MQLNKSCFKCSLECETRFDEWIIHSLKTEHINSLKWLNGLNSTRGSATVKSHKGAPVVVVGYIKVEDARLARLNIQVSAWTQLHTHRKQRLVDYA